MRSEGKARRCWEWRRRKFYAKWIINCVSWKIYQRPDVNMMENRRRWNKSWIGRCWMPWLHSKTMRGEISGVSMGLRAGTGKISCDHSLRTKRNKLVCQVIRYRRLIWAGKCWCWNRWRFFDDAGYFFLFVIVIHLITFVLFQFFLSNDYRRNDYKCNMKGIG